uniref:Peptidase S1 domain-containing protein n=1 Tax=Daphnia galeata TaxID=27404 RepID=A0A8J2W681_9CRUS|nr:unnamed protein product [Daphnia galeata]
MEYTRLFAFERSRLTQVFDRKSFNTKNQQQPNNQQRVDIQCHSRPDIGSKSIAINKKGVARRVFILDGCLTVTAAARHSKRVYKMMRISCFVLAINFILTSCLSPANTFRDDRISIQTGYAHPVFLTPRQYMMAINPYGVGLFSGNPEPSPNPSDQLVPAPPIIPLTKEPADSSVPSSIPITSEPDSSVISSSNIPISSEPDEPSANPSNIPVINEPDSSVPSSIPLTNEPDTSVPSNIPEINESDSSVPSIPEINESDSSVPSHIPEINESDSVIQSGIPERSEPDPFDFPSIPVPSTEEEIEEDFDFNGGTLTSMKLQYPCGRGPTSFPTRQVNLDGDDTVNISGSEAKKNSWPFVVALRYDGAVKCGGFLISHNRVLTAAHCVERKSSFDILHMTVSFGMHTMGSSKLQTKEDSQMTRRVSRVIVPNGYNAGSLANDIAILVLESPVIYSDAISPVCLPPASTDPDQYADQIAAIMGWGASTSGGKQSDTLQQVTTSILTNSLCSGYYSKLTKNMFCTYTSDKTSCQGDSGGPVVVQSESGAWTAVGLNSYSRMCETTEYPSVKTRISAYVSWINKNLK